MVQTRRVLVTGGAGFVGATLVRRLVASGHFVRVFDNYTTGDPAHLAGVDAELVEGDIRDAAALDAALYGLDSVIPLAAAGSVVMSVEDPVANFDVNVVGTFRVLDAARRAGVERTVQASTRGGLVGGAVLHIASGVETTVSDLADLCRAAAGLPDHPVEYRPKRPGEVDRNFASYDLAKEVLRYTPSISREEGIRSTWQWFQEEVFTD